MIEGRPCRRQKAGEARVTNRYSIAARVCFKWRTDKTWYRGTGVTHDIGCSGVSILTHREPPLGAEIEVMVTLPPIGQGAPAAGRLRGNGRVVRVTNTAGFAVAVTFHIVKADELATSQPF